MRTGYFDCFSGAAGDMILGALIDAGWLLEALRDVVGRLQLPGVNVNAARVDRGGIGAMHVVVHVGEESRKQHRHLPDILRIIEAAKLPTGVAERASEVFRRLAEAEARVHDTSVEKVHFHEVGAADAIVDIVGACAGVAQLGVGQVVCSPVPTGHGTVRCEHGVMPVPAPATALLLEGVPLAECDEPGELTTPTGAALLTTLADSFGPLPPVRIAAVGYGAGTRRGVTRPNFLRLIVGESDAAGATEQIGVLECQVDDATGQTVAYACERVLEAGALDAFIVPIIMKKGRPGQLLTVLCRPAAAGALEALLFRETPTLGVRRRTCERSTLPREVVTVATRFGAIRVKVVRVGDQSRAWPEYDDCARAAREADVPLREVQQEALAALRLPD